MSQTQTAYGGPRGRHGEEATSVTDDDGVETVLDALDDERCRTILSATSDAELTVAEISERHDIAQSTAYRKVDCLVEAGLLDERLRVRRSGDHVSAYTCDVEDVTVSVEADAGVELRLTRPEPPANERPQSVMGRAD